MATYDKPTGLLFLEAGVGLILNSVGGRVTEGGFEAVNTVEILPGLKHLGFLKKRLQAVITQRDASEREPFGRLTPRP